MSNNVVEFMFDQNKIRTTLVEDSVWFVASDVSKSLGYSQTNAMNKLVDDEDKTYHVMEDEKGYQNISLVSENGLYHAIVRCRKGTSLKRRLLDTLESSGFLKDVTLPTKNEEEFSELLVDFLQGFAGVSVEKQKVFGRYRVDFYIEAFNMVVEYDEAGHRYYCLEKETERCRVLSREFGLRLVRLSDRNSVAYNLGLLFREVCKVMETFSEDETMHIKHL